MTDLRTFLASAIPVTGILRPCRLTTYAVAADAADRRRTETYALRMVPRLAPALVDALFLMLDRS